MKLLEPHERRLEGKWVKTGATIVADDTAQRIEQLLSSQLTKVATAENGWEGLYVDKRDGRKWELTYPHSDWHGGGPPTLTCVSETYARAKYGTESRSQ